MKIIIYSRQASNQCGSQVEVLRKTIERRGDKIVGFVADDPKIIGRGKYAGWRAVVSELAQIDQIVVNSAGDLPGKSVGDLLKILATLCDHGVSLISLQDDIDTSSGSASVLRLVAAYRFVKRSEAIRAGQATARAKARFSADRLFLSGFAGKFGSHSSMAMASALRPAASTSVLAAL